MPADLVTRHDRVLLRAVVVMAATADARGARVVLDQGRLFTPAPWPRSGVPRRGAPGQCHRNALSIARLLPGAYVEGYVLAGDGTVRAYAWCSTADGTALDPARPDRTVRRSPIWGCP